MFLVDKNEEIFFHTIEKSNSDTVVVTNRRIYHSGKKVKGSSVDHQCINIEDVKMVRYSRKGRVKKKLNVGTFFLLIFLIFNILQTLAVFIASITEIGGDYASSMFLVLFVFTMLLSILYFKLRYRFSAYVEIEYGTGNKIKVTLNIKNEEVLVQIRNAIFAVQDAYNPILQ